MTDTRRSEIRDAAIEYRHILDYDDNDLPEEQISELIDFILELTAPEPPKAQPEESQEVLWESVFAILWGLDPQPMTREALKSMFTLVRKPGKEEDLGKSP